MVGIRENEEELILKWGRLYRVIRADIAEILKDENKRKARELCRAVKKLKPELERIIKEYSLQENGKAHKQRLNELLSLLAKIQKTRPDYKYLQAIEKDIHDVLGMMERKRVIVESARKGAAIPRKTLMLILIPILVGFGVAKAKAETAAARMTNQQAAQVLVLNDSDVNSAKKKVQDIILQVSSNASKHLSPFVPSGDGIWTYDDTIRIDASVFKNPKKMREFAERLARTLDFVKYHRPMDYKYIKKYISVIILIKKATSHVVGSQRTIWAGYDMTVGTELDRAIIAIHEGRVHPHFPGVTNFEEVIARNYMIYLYKKFNASDWLVQNFISQMLSLPEGRILSDEELKTYLGDDI